MKSLGYIAFFCALLPLSSASPAVALEAGLLPSTVKVRPDTGSTASTILITAAGGEWEAFQIAIRDNAGASSVNVELSGFTGLGGSIIPASRARLYREHYLEIKDPSPVSITLHERVAGNYPDPLIPFADPYGSGTPGAPFDILPGITTAVYAEWFVPAGTPHGAYTGTALVTAAGKAPVTLDVVLNVWEFDLPRTVATSYFFDEREIRKYHGGPDGQAPANYQQIVDRYWNALHEHRLDPTNFWGSVQFKYDAGGGLLPVDWSMYDKAVGPWLDGSRFDDGVGVVNFNIVYLQPGNTRIGSPTDEQYALIGAEFARHFSVMGWIDRAIITTADEPWLGSGDTVFNEIKKDVALIRKYTALWDGRFLTTSPYDARLEGTTSIWCPMTQMYEDWFAGEDKPGRDVYRQRMALGEQLWFYVCNSTRPPYAGYDIDTATGYEPRILKWHAWFENAGGFLYWSTNAWVDDNPWNVFKDVKRFGAPSARNGDGFLFYPGDHNGTSGNGSPDGVSLNGPVISYRMKQIRDGLEDWELFRMAVSLGADVFTWREVERAYNRLGVIYVENCMKSPPLYCPDDQPWTLDRDVLQDVRSRVAAKILFLLHPGRYPDPENPLSDGGYDSGADAIYGDSGTGDGSLPDSAVMDAGTSGDGGLSDGSTDAGSPGPRGGCGCSTVSFQT
ncbi:MAG: glycoside hydrolase domain-containing protein [Myxococcota bacterium]